MGWVKRDTVSLVTFAHYLRTVFKKNTVAESSEDGDDCFKIVCRCLVSFDILMMQMVT